MSLVPKLLLAALAALVVARPLVSGDDPARLRLTSGAGAVSFNLAVLLLLAAYAVFRFATGTTRPRRWPWLAILLAGVGVAAFLSGRLGDGYARPTLFIAWEWLALAALAFLTTRLTANDDDNRGLVNVLLASAVSIAGLAAYQAMTGPLGLPTMDVAVPAESFPLAGDVEFHPEMNRPPTATPGPRGTFDSPATLVVFLAMSLPSLLAQALVHRRWLLMPVQLVVVALAATLASNPFSAAAMPAFHGLTALGVGPGNYARHFADSPAAWPEWWATAGVIGFGLLIAALGVGLFLALRQRQADPSTRGSGPRWEFHVGGMVGLLLGFVWATGDVPAEAPSAEVFKLGSAAIVRAILWFGAFALLETVRSGPRRLAPWLALGVGIAVISGFFLPSPALPTLLVTMAVMLALAGNEGLGNSVIADGSWVKPLRFGGILVALTLAIGYLVTAALPAYATASNVRHARMSSRHFPEMQRAISRARPGPERATALSKARNYLQGNIVNPLSAAAERDPRNAALWLELARWRRPLWEFQLVADPEDAARIAESTIRAADRASKLDPKNPAGLKTLFEALLLYRGNSKAGLAERLTAIDDTIGRIAENDPTAEVPLRLRVVRMLLDRGDIAGVESHITTLLRRNAEPGSPHGSMTADDKREVINRAIKLLVNPSPELLEEWVK